MAMIECVLAQLWREKEAKENRDITFLEVAEYAGVHRDTISKLFHGKTTRFDAPLLAKVAEYFGVKEGDPIPFLILRLGNKNTNQKAA